MVSLSILWNRQGTLESCEFVHEAFPFQNSNKRRYVKIHVTFDQPHVIAT